MIRPILTAFAFLAGSLVGGPARADEFDRLEGRALLDALQAPGVETRPRVSTAEIGNQAPVLKGVRGAVLLARTDQGNVARLVVSSALRKAPGTRGEAVPIVVVERFETFDPSQATTRIARGRDLFLFDGFRLDLDAGCVVPEGQGGDLGFETKGSGGPSLVAAEGVTLQLCTRPLRLPEPARGGGPSSGRAVLAADFAGRYRLQANGQWTGLLALDVKDHGEVVGTFRSDANGSVYPVRGRIAPDRPNRIEFTIEYPRTRQDYEGFLWTEGKWALAGRLTMLDRPYGFFAIREGSTAARAAEDVGLVVSDDDDMSRIDLSLRQPDQFVWGNDTLDRAALIERLKSRQAEVPETWVRFRVARTVPFADVRAALDALRAAGIVRIRLDAIE